MNRTRGQAWAEPAAVAGLFLLGLVLRVYGLHEMPPGLHFDEAANGLDALDVLGGVRSVFFERNYGREPLFIYLEAVSIAVGGATPFALRVTSAVVGAMTVPALYWTVREASAERAGASKSLAFWSALILATSYWHLNFSRIGYRAILLPLMVCLTFSFFWRAWRRLRSEGAFPWTSAAVCGVLLGVSQYTYTAARFLPLLVALVAGVGLVSGELPVGQRRRAIGALGIIAVTAVIVFAPLGAYFIGHEESFLARAAQVSIVGPQASGRSAAQALLDSSAATAGMFLVAGDANIRHNPAQRPILDPALGAMVLVGLVICLRRCRSLPYAALLLSLAIFALPAVLTISEVPHSLRSLGMLPAICVLPAIGIAGLGTLVGRRWRRVAILLPIPFVLFASVSGISDYFRAVRSNSVAAAFQQSHFSLASYLSSHGTASGTLLVPISSAALWMLPTTDDYIVRFLFRGQASWGVVAADPAKASEDLRTLARPGGEAYLIRDWLPSAQPEGLYLYADPKHLLPFLLTKYGSYRGATDAGAFQYDTYDLPVSSDYRVATAYSPVHAAFGDQVDLTGLAYGRTSSGPDDGGVALDEHGLCAGEKMWVTLQWQPTVPITTDLKTTLRLTNAAGDLAGQLDELLVGDGYPFSRVWKKGEVAYTYSILPTPEGITPGEYDLSLGVYEAQSGQRWGALSADLPYSASVTLGSIQITQTPAGRRTCPAPQPSSSPRQ